MNCRWKTEYQFFFTYNVEKCKENQTRSHWNYELIGEHPIWFICMHFYVPFAWISTLNMIMNEAINNVSNSLKASQKKISWQQSICYPAPARIFFPTVTAEFTKYEQKKSIVLREKNEAPEWFIRIQCFNLNNEILKCHKVYRLKKWAQFCICDVY